MHMQPIDPHACTLVNNLISHREKKSNHTDIKLSVINKSSSYNIINKTFKKAHFTPSSYPILPLSLGKKKKKVTDNSLQSQSMQNSYISNIKIQIHKITIETK